MLRSDALRSFAFIFSVFILLYLNVPKKISPAGFFTFLILMIAADLAMVDKRYFTRDNYQRKRDTSRFTPRPADEIILRDKSNYRVFNLSDFYEAFTSQFHHSLGGYNGVRLKRYQELYDSSISREGKELVEAAQKGDLDPGKYGVMNMLNAKYFVYGPEATNVIQNPANNGNAWFVKEVSLVNSPNEELARTNEVNTKQTAVVDGSKFRVDIKALTYDSLATISLVDQKPYWLKYESQSVNDGLAVFSEIYYPKGWHAFIDGKEVPILRADYVLRALLIPAGKHGIEFKFEPKPYTIGDRVTMASGWVLLIVVVGCLSMELRKSRS
jgi:hypothetical protein